MLKENEFKNVFSRGTELQEIDTIRDTLKVIELDGLKQMLNHTVKNQQCYRKYGKIFKRRVKANLLHVMPKTKAEAIKALDLLYVSN